MSKIIFLTKGKTTTVDDEDFTRLSAHKWHVYETKGRTSYACRRVCQQGGSRKTLFMHVEIMGEGIEIDHKDGDGLNNQKLNLRRATRQMQSQNRAGNRNSSSQYKGVSFSKSRSSKGLSPWRAQYRKDGVTKHIGYFIDEKIAAEAYDEIAQTVFENGILNFR